MARTVLPTPSDDEEEFFPDPIELPLEDVLDLHPFPPKEIASLVEDYLREAYKAGFPAVRIIHGKGIGVQREIVRAVASRNPHVTSIRQAPEGAGGWGATLVEFRQP
ncbi:DNA mismatch repair protein MutS [candidate division KSB3 bacterium]|uniref:DNA mismatch repair protein MutS n=1 Tax=candidate division KSB3 bacterium TaxID=2044937 RepID=A0A9D5JUV3_9BACT|nr:DNA mismatch repair protein MutS [candidate division KSB3 bacterium]MBD3324698.1 DNA mismatch repair protein MutS [candidate division KSB3 bacterium]